MLVASELVNNAVVHSDCTPRHDLEVCARWNAGRLTISVHDPGVSGGAAVPTSSDVQISGWGLRIVEELCERWGDERRDGYQVWAEIKLPAERCPGP
jgi:anti-sigma regulatory factor (Ser/Thr protein kinase)